MFNDYESLIEELKKKAKNYPLLAKVYIPIIENHAKESPKHKDIDDWLCIPWFEYLYQQDTVKLYSLEKGLQDIGIQNFEKLCEEIYDATRHPVINGIHDKLFENQAELWGMREYISQGFSVEKIKRSDKESTPDLRATKADCIYVIECKFIHASDRIKTFIKRYTRFLGLFCSAYKDNESLISKLDFEINSKQPHELTQDLIDLIKNFIKEIIYKKLATHETTLHYNVKGEQHFCKITYTRDREPEPCLVSIQNQLTFVEQQLKCLHDGYISRLIQTTKKKQLAKAESAGVPTCLFICVQLDESLLLPWEGIESIKNKFFIDENVIIKDVSGLV